MCILLGLLLGSSGSGKSKNDPRNDVDNYFGPEDYYDDHWTDFKDEDEAKDYYYKHGGM